MYRFFICTIFWVFNFLFVSNGFSYIDTSTPPTCYDNGGIIGMISTQDTRFDSLVMSTSNGFDVIVDQDTVISRTPHHIWADVTLGSISLTSNIPVSFQGFDPIQATIGNYDRTVEVSRFSLINTDLNTGVKLSFAGNSNEINLTNSSIWFSRQQPIFLATAPLTINSISGSNKFYNWSGKISAQSTAIDIQSGSTLLFDQCGSLSHSASDDQKLYFSNPVTGTVDNSIMTVNYSNIYFNSSSFDFTNSSSLSITGSDSAVEFESVSFDSSTLTVDSNAKFEARNLILDNNVVFTINAGAEAIVTDLLDVQGDAELNGTGTAIGLSVNAINLADNVTFSQNGSKIDVEKDLYLMSGAQLNINNSAFSVYQPWGRGGTVNVTNGGEFTLTGTFKYLSRQATFNIDAASFFWINQDYTRDADMILGPMLTVNNDGNFGVADSLSGSGTISGTGTTTIYERGYVSPGLSFWASSASDYIGTITFENMVLFRDNSTEPRPYAYSQYNAHIDVVGGVESSDLLRYDDMDFDISGLTFIRVDLASTLSANELDGKSFTVISSVDAGSTGNLVIGGNYPGIYELGSVPALIDFTVTNESTNGNDDVTIHATMQNAMAILTHPSIVPVHTPSTTTTSKTDPNNPNNTVTTTVQITPSTSGAATQTTTVVTTDSGGATVSSSTATTQVDPAQGSNNINQMASLLVNAINNGNTSIQNALNTLTNAQTGPHIESLHAEPFSSNLTVALEQNDLFLSMLLGHNRFSKIPVYSDHLGETHHYVDKQIWFETACTKGKVRGKNNLGTFEYTLSNFIFGKDFTDNKDSNVGLYLGIGHQKMDEHDSANQDFKGVNYHFGAYGALQYTNWQLHLASGYGYGRNESKRRVQLGSTLDGVNEDKFSSHGVYIGVKGLFSPVYDNTFMSLSPDVSLLYNFYQQDEIDEKGVGSLALKVDSVVAQNLVLGVGVNASFKHSGRWQKLRPVAFIRYERDLLADSDDYHKVKAALTNHPSQKGSFTGQNRGADILTTGIGISGDIGEKWQLNGGIVQGWASQGTELGFGLNAVYKF